MSLKKHQKIWLKAHPEYDDVWMLTALAAGFDVHHLDENKENNHPDNLLMIERRDHMKIHGLSNFLKRKESASWEAYADRIAKGLLAYNMRSESNISWLDVAKNLGYQRESGALNVAKAYAKYHKLQWPIPHHADCICGKC